MHLLWGGLGSWVLAGMRLCVFKGMRGLATPRNTFLSQNLVFHKFSTGQAIVAYGVISPWVWLGLPGFNAFSVVVMLRLKGLSILGFQGVFCGRVGIGLLAARAVSLTNY